MILSVQDLIFSYPNHSVLKELNFSLLKGDCVAVLGTNGAGKSTLLKCLNRILQPEAGVIKLAREDVFNLGSKKLAQKMGYVPQQPVPARCTVFDAVLLGRKPYIKWDVRQSDLEITHRVLRLLELEAYSLRYLDELSGGELQMVVIARALAQEPQLLLFDEPTHNLDLKNQMEVIKTIRKVVKSQQIAAIVTMHDLNLALRFANKFLLLKRGAIYAAGGLEVITPQNIEAVYALPVAIERWGNVPVVVPLEG